MLVLYTSFNQNHNEPIFALLIDYAVLMLLRFFPYKRFNHRPDLFPLTDSERHNPVFLYLVAMSNFFVRIGNAYKEIIVMIYL